MNEKVKTFFRGVGIGIFTAICFLGGLLSYFKKRDREDSSGTGRIEELDREYESEVQTALGGLSETDRILSEVEKRKPIDL